MARERSCRWDQAVAVIPATPRSPCRPNCGARNRDWLSASGSVASGRRRLRLAQHFRRDVAFGDLTQRDHGGLVVLPGNGGLGAIGEAARALAASSTSWKMFSTLGRQSSTVTRAMSLTTEQAIWGDGSLLEKLVDLPGFAPSNGPRLVIFSPGGPHGPHRRRAQPSKSLINGFELRRVRTRNPSHPAAAISNSLTAVSNSIIDDDAVELRVMGHIGDRIAQPALDHLFAVGHAVAKTLFQRAPGRGKDEDRPALGLRLAHLPRALPVDLQDHVDAFAAQRLRRLRDWCRRSCRTPARARGIRPRPPAA